MKREIDAAVDFLMRMVLISFHGKNMTEVQLLELRITITNMMFDAYENHWYPSNPLRGSAYRCIRINGVLDPLVKRAGEVCGYPYRVYRGLFPPEMTVWVDPNEVSYRFGEEGSINHLPLPPESVDSGHDSFTSEDLGQQVL